MKSIDQLRLQLSQILRQDELIPSGVAAREIQENNGNLELLKGILCGSLAPNLVRADQQRIGVLARRGMLSTRYERDVGIHRTSLFKNLSKPLSQHWLVYFEKVQHNLLPVSESLHQ